MKMKMERVKNIMINIHGNDGNGDGGVLSQLRMIPKMRNENENGEGEKHNDQDHDSDNHGNGGNADGEDARGDDGEPSLRRSFIPTQKCGNLFSYLLYGS